MNFVGYASKVGILSFTVSLETISQATEIPRSGEEWFKATKFKLKNIDDFLKQENVGVDITLGIPRSCLKENYLKLLLVIHKYFTCEGIFHMIYQYHFRLILHFKVKKS